MDCVFCDVFFFFCAVLGPPRYGSQHMGRHSKICNAPVMVTHFWKVVFLRQILVHGWLQRIGVHVHVELGESSKHRKATDFYRFLVFVHVNKTSFT